MENTRPTTHDQSDAPRPTLRQRARVAAAQLFALRPNPERGTLASVLARITGLSETGDASPTNNHDISVGGEVCVVPMPAMPDGICGTPLEPEPELLVCHKHAAETAEFDPFADLPPWENLPDLITDGPACPNCGTDDTRWDAISPDYPGDWWTCGNGHRFLLDHDGRTWRET